MINLLPTDVKTEIIYARNNRNLIGWVFAMILVIIGIVAMTLFGQIFIVKNTNNLQSVANVAKQRIDSQNLTETQKSIQNLSNNFTTVTQLLSKQLIFSKLFNKIGNIIPSGSVLNGINLTTTNAALDLNIGAINKESATQSFINISDPKNGLFEKSDLISVNCIQPSSANSVTSNKYPCTAMVKVVMKTGSEYYFLNSLTNKGVAN